MIVGYTEEGNYIYIDPNYSDKGFECSPDYLNIKNASKYDLEIKKKWSYEKFIYSIVIEHVLLWYVCVCTRTKNYSGVINEYELGTTRLFYEGDCGYIKYTKTQDIYIEKIDNTIDRVYSNYYLSSSPDTVFDRNKVGKNNNGKYIIRDGGDYVFVSEILELTATKLVLRNLTPGFTTTGKVTTYLKTNMNF